MAIYGGTIIPIVLHDGRRIGYTLYTTLTMEVIERLIRACSDGNDVLPADQYGEFKLMVAEAEWYTNESFSTFTGIGAFELADRVDKRANES